MQQQDARRYACLQHLDNTLCGDNTSCMCARVVVMHVCEGGRDVCVRGVCVGGE